MTERITDDMPRYAKELVSDFVNAVPDHTWSALTEILHKARTPEEFASMLWVGRHCPSCGSSCTVNGYSSPLVAASGVDDGTFAVCLECNYRWCPGCLQPVETWPCPHWDAWGAYCNSLTGPDVDEYGYEPYYLDWLQGYIARKQVAMMQI